MDKNRVTEASTGRSTAESTLYGPKLRPNIKRQATDRCVVRMLEEDSFFLRQVRTGSKTARILVSRERIFLTQICCSEKMLCPFGLPEEIR